MKRSILLTCTLLLCLSASSQPFLYHIKQHIDTLASLRYGGRAPGTLGDTLSANYIVGQLSLIDGIELLGDDGFQKIEYRSKDEIVRSFNVVAKISATQKNNPKGEYIVLGAHYDHVGLDAKGKVCWGADDNASGTGYLIELARRYALQRSKLHYDVLFIAFSGEEEGLKGSQYYTEHPLLPLKKCKIMINFDMLGRMSRSNEITIRGIGSAKEIATIFGTLHFDKLNIAWEFRSKGPTDYASFCSKEIPAVSFSTRGHKDYHTTADTPDKINYAGIERIDAYIGQFINRVLDPQIKVTYIESVW